MADKKEKGSKTQEIRYRRWCLTIWQNDELFPNKEAVAKFITKHKVKYLIIGDERTKSDKPHFQTYIEYENGRSFNSIKKQFPKLAHIEEAKGSAQQNIDYCSKTDLEPLTIGYCNIVNETLSKGDIASNLVDLFLSYDYGQMPPLYELIRDYPSLSDYIVKNYYVLEKIYNDIKRDKQNYHFKPKQMAINVEEIEESEIPF